MVEAAPAQEGPNLVEPARSKATPFAVSRELVSVIVPVYNEAQNLRVLIPSLSETLQSLGVQYEIVVVDDGSTDETAGTLRALSSPALRLVHLRRNTGQTAALMAGIRFSRGEVL